MIQKNDSRVLASDLESCDTITLSWTGGTAPYIVELVAHVHNSAIFSHARSVEDDQGVPLERAVTDTFASEFFWGPDLDSPPYPMSVIQRMATSLTKS
jgi:hypothetical protein